MHQDMLQCANNGREEEESVNIAGFANVLRKEMHSAHFLGLRDTHHLLFTRKLPFKCFKQKTDETLKDIFNFVVITKRLNMTEYEF